MSEYLIDEGALSAGTLYRLMSGAICPRPIAWVATCDAEGRSNLAPFSFFNVASVNPPVLAFSPLLDGEGHAKDTLNNIEATGECVVHVGSEDLIEALNATSASLAPGEDEFAHAGLDKATMAGVRVPRIATAPIAFGCTRHDVIRFGDQPLSGSLVLARVVSLYVDERIWDGRHVDIDVLKPTGRLAGNDYLRATDRFVIERPR